MRMPISNFNKAIACANLFGLVLAPVLTAHAEDKQGCAAFAWSIAREQALFAGSDQASLTLSLEADVAFPLKPDHKSKSEKPNGAFVTFTNAQPGIYQVTLSDEGWIDVIQNGRALPAVAHSGRKDCPGVRKSVRFDLAAGPYTVEISDAQVPVMKIAIVPAE